MNKSSVLKRHLSTLLLVVIYLFTATVHLLSDSFQLVSQLDVLFMMLPFIFYGIILDFTLSRNTNLDPILSIIAKILPCGIFLVQIMNTILLYQNNETSDMVGISLWIFLTLPFFISSYTKENFKHEIIQSIIISGVISIVYGYLTTQTEYLYRGYGTILYFISYVFIFYIADRFIKFPYTAIVLGVLNVVVLLSFRFTPFTEEAKLNGWDTNLLLLFEILLLVTFIVAALLYLLSIISSIKEAKPIQGNQMYQNQ